MLSSHLRLGLTGVCFSQFPQLQLCMHLSSPHLECISLNINGSKQSLITSAWLVALPMQYFPQESHMIACLLLTHPFPGVCSLYRGFMSAQNLTLMVTTVVGGGVGGGGVHLQGGMSAEWAG